MGEFMSSSEFSHSVEIDEKHRLLKIFRVFPDGRKQFYTETDVPSAGGSSTFEVLSRTVGEALLMDSPAARRLMQL